MDEKLILPASDTEPEINFDSATGILNMKGFCLSDNSAGYFLPVRSWFELHMPSFPDTIEFNLELVCVKPQWLVEIARLLRLLEKSAMQGHTVKIMWNCTESDQEMKEAGQVLESMIRNSVEFKSK